MVEKIMTIKEVQFPAIYHNGQLIGYGGNQEWFQKKWHRDAGCASTTGANLAAYYAAKYPQMKNLPHGENYNFEWADYLSIMDELFSYMKPGFLGYPFARSFAIQFIRFGRDHDLLLKLNRPIKYRSASESYAYVKEHIDAGQPIALLVLFHRAKELEHINWHWMTITGYSVDQDEPQKEEIIISNYGQRETVNLQMLFEKHPKNVLRMVSFHIPS